MTWYSQAGQDAFVIDWLGTEPGYFVDIGAHDGNLHSNTLALEERGWNGLCVEPNPSAFDDLRGNRGCQISRYAVSNYDGLLYFDGVRVGAGGPSVECRTLTHLLDLHAAPPTVDYLSVDVEGHELEVLAGMDFDRWHVRLITIETNVYVDGPGRKDAIYQVLSGYGFERVVEDVMAPGYGIFEDWYANAS